MSHKLEILTTILALVRANKHKTALHSAEKATSHPTTARGRQRSLGL